MQELFVKKYWKEENIWFYIQFQNKQAIRQIELSSRGKVFLTLENSQNGESMLYDQTIEELDLESSDFITKDEFEKEWQD
ncbi:hypothetical protein ACTJJ0_12255 [Chitinophaga sp. 22321]|uniref:Uncharacterized protein n=1 Tax=Chitinophaga hostae TaxID=2831022 RepID=A0ABS5IWA0_9BACT|nr:hypothetical protein [Chitinophaga hostae]MBS0027230.1 hypothetical protein [Chitinophaga hostae]